MTDPKNSQTLDDLILVDKPKGISSFDVIRRLRKELGIRKMGHAGTLDPLATGLLIIGTGKGTKKLNYLIGLPKIYRATVLIGRQTNTGDLEGINILEKKVPRISNEEIRRALESMTGTLKLHTPLYSAVKVSGTPLYKRARRGEPNLKPPIKTMEMRSFTLHNITHKEDTLLIDVTLNVSKGTYIRSLAEELGKRLGYPATLAKLRRTAIGNFSVEDARTV